MNRRFALLPIALLLAGGLLPGVPRASFAADPAPAGETSTAATLADLSLEELAEVELVYAASRYEQSVADAPADVTILTQVDIERHGWRTLAELLRGVRGYFVTNDRAYAYAGIRGFGRLGDYNSRILMLVDGHRLNENIYDQSFLGDDLPIELAALERVEIVRGPASSLYGTSALFGSINLVTRAPAADAGVRIVGAYGSHGAARSTVLASRAGAAGGFFATVSGFRGDGEDLRFAEFADVGSTQGWARGLDGGSLGRAFVRVDRGRLQLTAVAHRRAKDIPTAFYETAFGAAGTRISDSRNYLDLAYRQPWGRDGEFSLRGAYDIYEFDGTYRYEEGDPGAEQPVDYTDYGYGHWLSFELQGNRAVGDRLRAVGGAEARINTVQDQGAEGPAGTIFATRTTSSSGAVFGQLEWAPVEGLHLVPGARLDAYRHAATAFTPRFVAFAQVGPRTRLLGSLAQAFRMPNPFEREYVYLDQKAAPDLARERMRAAEFGIDREFSPTWAGHATVFHYGLRNLIAAEIDPADGLTVFRNESDKVRATGVELELKMRLPSGWRGSASWSEQRVRVGDVDAAPANSPRSTWQAMISGPLGTKGAALGLSAAGVAARSTLAGARVDPYARVDANVTGPPWTRAGLRLSLRCTNLFDVGYADPAATEFTQDSLPGEGRQFSVGATARF